MGQGETPGPRQAAGQTLPGIASCPLCLQPAPRPQPPRPGLWGKGQTSQSMVVTSMGGCPGPLVFTSGQQAQVDLFFPRSSKAAHPWSPAITPTQTTGLAPAPPPRCGEPSPLCTQAHAPHRDRRPRNGPRGQVPGLRVGTGQRQSAPSMAPDIPSYGRRPPPSNLGRQSPPHLPPVTTSRRHPAIITTLPAPWCRPSRGGRRHHWGYRGPCPHQSHHHGAQRTGPRPLPCPPMVTGPDFHFRRRCAGRFPFLVCRPYVFIPHLALLGWLKDGQRAELALIDWLDFTRGHKAPRGAKLAAPGFHL